MSGKFRKLSTSYDDLVSIFANVLRGKKLRVIEKTRNN
jgi:hypothetical protein